jgi:hypothetical protein
VALERVQRLHLGIDEEEMEFSAATIASMLQEVADTCDESEAFTIHAVVRALQGADEDHELVLKQKRRGKYVSPTEHVATHNRNMSWLRTLALRESQGVKTEAAIAEIAEKWGVKRASVFEGVRDAQRFLKAGRETFGGPNFENPRPAKNRKT